MQSIIWYGEEGPVQKMCLSHNLVQLMLAVEKMSKVVIRKLEPKNKHVTYADTVRNGKWNFCFNGWKIGKQEKKKETRIETNARI